MGHGQPLRKLDLLTHGEPLLGKLMGHREFSPVQIRTGHDRVGSAGQGRDSFPASRQGGLAVGYSGKRITIPPRELSLRAEQAGPGAGRQNGSSHLGFLQGCFSQLVSLGHALQKTGVFGQGHERLGPLSVVCVASFSYGGLGQLLGLAVMALGPRHASQLGQHVGDFGSLSMVLVEGTGSLIAGNGLLDPAQVTQDMTLV